MKTFIVKTKKMVFGGSCIAEIDGKTVFIPYCLPNEAVEISIVKEYKSYSQAKIEKIMSPSPYRIKPLCPHFYDCGGCNLQMAHDDYQRELRKYMAMEALERAIPSCSIDPKFISGDAWKYRSRFQLHITADRKFSQKKANTNEVIPINECPIAVSAIQNLLKEKNHRLETGTRVHIFSDDEKIFTNENANECYASILDKKIKFNPLGFFQSNLQMTEKVIKTIFLNFNPVNRILDFYSGVGTLSLFAVEYANEIHLVEHNKYAQQYAKLNFNNEPKVISQKTNIFYHAIDGKKWSNKKESHLKFDVVFLDPPRNGVDKTSLLWLCEKKIPKIYYLSCDPVSFARDSSKLLESGYLLEDYFLFDFYPQTHHIETLGIFKYL